MFCFFFLKVLFTYTLHIKAFHLLGLSHPGIVGHGLPLKAWTSSLISHWMPILTSSEYPFSKCIFQEGMLRN